MTEKQGMNLEDLIAETEQKILNNEYFEDVDIEYKDTILHVRIRPISQKRFTEITKDKNAIETAEFNTLMVKECVLNKHNNKPFTREQVEQFFDGGLTAILSLKCLELSGITINQSELSHIKKF